jgi:hypothetical protein
MKHVFVTACAVTALCGTAFAQTPTTKDNMVPSAPAAQQGMMGSKTQGAVHVTFYSVKPADVRSSTLVGATVYNAKNENIGEIEDLIIEDGKTLRAVVIGVGGFLGMGEHDVAVEPSALIVTRNNDKDDVRIVINTTKEDLKNAPAVKFDKQSRENSAASERPAATTGAGTHDMMKKDK